MLALAAAFWIGASARAAVVAGAGAPLPPIQPGPKDGFADVTARCGVDFVHRFCHRRIANILLSNGSGGAALDFDNDGLLDLYLVNWEPLKGVAPKCPARAARGNRLYRNRGDGTFEDVTARAGVAGAGYASAAAAADFDNDGFTDIYVVNIGPNILYRNRGDGTFEDVTAKAGVGDRGSGIGATWLDIDNDGLLDLYVANYLTFDPSTVSEENPGAYPGPLAYPGEADVLYRNCGNGKFEDATRRAGVYAPGQRAMGVVAFDCDRDGDADIYVCNDDTPNILWLNDGTGHFQNVAAEQGVAFNSIGEAPGSMNAAVGDADGNGLPDLYVTRLGYGSLYLRMPEGHYLDAMWKSGLGRITRKSTAWGGVLFDADNDGDPDAFTANGSAFYLDGSLSLFLENLGKARFVNAADKGGAFFRTPVNGRGAAAWDFNNDGRMDLLGTLLADRPVILENRLPAVNHWLKLKLIGTRANRNGYGALIALRAGGRVLVGQAHCPVGFLTQGDDRIHFGLGKASKADEIQIRWPGGQRQVLRNVPADQILTIHEPR